MTEPGEHHPDPAGGRAPQRPKSGRMRWLFLALAIALLVVPRLFNPGAATTRVPYSRFVQLLDSNRVASVVIGDTYVRGTLKSPAADGSTEFIANRVEPALASDLRSRGVEFSGETQSGFVSALVSWLLPTLLFVGVWWFLTRRAFGGQAAGLATIGKSRAKVYVERDTKVTFDDVAGVDEAKAELREVVAFLSDPASFGRLGAHVPKGVLLVGPPGTGKTLLARAVAGEASVPFISINGSEFVELFVGLGAARMRDLFERARQSAPCIIFIDEIDALGRMRGMSGLTGVNDEKEQTLNQLLAEVDGFSTEGGVILLAATNRPEILDPALLRAGRFDRQILVDRPDRAGRVQILRVHTRKVRIAPRLDLDQVAALTPGFTGADMASLVNEAALAATRRGAETVALEDFTVAVERIVTGLAKKSRVLTAREREITAYHEMGHAIVALATPGADPVHKVSIIPHGLGALGFTLQRPSEERYIATQAELEGKMTVLLGGRAAELTVFGELSTGAADDLVRATELAQEMVTRYGMDETVGNVAYGEHAGMLQPNVPRVAPESRLYSEQTAREIELAVRMLLRSALDRALATLARNRTPLDEGAHLLMDRESLTHDQLPAVVVAAGAPRRPGAAVVPGPPPALPQAPLSIAATERSWKR